MIRRLDAAVAELEAHCARANAHLGTQMSSVVTDTEEVLGVLCGAAATRARLTRTVGQQYAKQCEDMAFNFEVWSKQLRSAARCGQDLPVQSLLNPHCNAPALATVLETQTWFTEFVRVIPDPICIERCSVTASRACVRNVPYCIGVSVRNMIGEPLEHDVQCQLDADLSPHIHVARRAKGEYTCTFTMGRGCNMEHTAFVFASGALIAKWRFSALLKPPVAFKCDEAFAVMAPPVNMAFAAAPALTTPLRVNLTTYFLGEVVPEQEADVWCRMLTVLSWYSIPSLFDADGCLRYLLGSGKAVFEQCVVSKRLTTYVQNKCVQFVAKVHRLNGYHTGATPILYAALEPLQYDQLPMAFCVDYWYGDTPPAVDVYTFASIHEAMPISRTYVIEHVLQLMAHPNGWRQFMALPAPVRDDILDGARHLPNYTRDMLYLNWRLAQCESADIK